MLFYVPPSKLLYKLKEAYGDWTDSYKHSCIAGLKGVRSIDDPPDKDCESTHYHTIWLTNFNLPSVHEWNSMGSLSRLGSLNNVENGVHIMGKVFLHAKIYARRESKHQRSDSDYVSLELKLVDLNVYEKDLAEKKCRDYELQKEKDDIDKLKFL